MPDEPTLGEVSRSIQDMRAELRAMRGDLVRHDVYAANRSSDELRARTLEAGLAQIQEERAAMRRLVYGAFATALGSVVVEGIIAFANHKP